jgi:methylmalonyl-CoA/ethylmalonyl-CoA epimerase
MSNLEFWHHHGGVSVPDLDASIAWYRTMLGFEVEQRFPLPVL